MRGDGLHTTAIQNAVMEDEREQIDNGLDYSDQQVRQAAVHTRQDMILLAAYANLAAKRLKTIKNLVWVMTVLIALACLKYLIS